uniref:Uncharacterized protein n=1 Tax=Arundo donax TaxID=35708 RepID=A0A0A9B153_ARUDO
MVGIQETTVLCTYLEPVWLMPDFATTKLRKCGAPQKVWQRKMLATSVPKLGGKCVYDIDM